MQDTSTDYEELTGSIQSGYYIKSGIANNNEDLFYMSVFITISARTYEELLWRRGQMTDLLKSMDMYVGDCNFRPGGRIALRHAVSLHRPEHREEGAAEHPHKRRGVHIYVHLV